MSGALRHGPHAAAALWVLAATALLAAVPWAAPRVADAALLPAHRAALLTLYDATGGPSWRVNVGWRDGAVNTKDPCQDRWQGVTCDESFSRLTYVRDPGVGSCAPARFPSGVCQCEV